MIPTQTAQCKPKASDKNSVKELTRLPDGDYRFHLPNRAFQKETAETLFQKEPWRVESISALEIILYTKAGEDPG
jgi:hypothetical protein